MGRRPPTSRCRRRSDRRPAQLSPGSTAPSESSIASTCASVPHVGPPPRSRRSPPRSSNSPTPRARAARAGRRPRPGRPAVPVEDRRDPHPGRRRNVEGKAEAVQPLLRASALRQAAAIEAAYATIAASQIRLIGGLNTQLPALEEVVAHGFGRHPDAELYLSQPGLGTVLGARVLA